MASSAEYPSASASYAAFTSAEGLNSAPATKFTLGRVNKGTSS